MPPEDHPDRRDDRARNNPAETRTRQEYYSDLRATVSREESAATRQATADEHAATDKWQEKSTESRWIWTEYQRKWPPAERPSTDRSLDSAENSRVDAECDRIARREEERISPAMRSVESQDPNRHLIGFDDRLKGRDRIKEKVLGTIKDFSRSPEQAVSLVPDTIRYTFQYREARYTQDVWADIERLKNEGLKLHKIRNSWSDDQDQYKGINSQWIEPDTGQRFEVQFHTSISFEAKQLTHTAYERLRTPGPNKPDKFEQMILEAF